MLRKVIFLLLLFACSRPHLAKAQPVQPTPQSFQNHRFTTLNVPPDLPDYQIHAELDIHKRLVKASQKVTYKNRTNTAQSEVVFHVYPKYRTAPSAKLKLAKTLEVLRLGPDEAIDPKGDRLQVQSVSINGQTVSPKYEGDDQTIMAIALNAPLEPGQSIQIDIDFTLDLPNQWGRIVNIASVAGIRAVGSGRTAYGTSKAAVIALTRQMAVELADHGITANAVAPGPVDTPMTRTLHNDRFREEYTKAIPMNRYGSTTEIAAAVMYLVSEAAAYTSGIVLPVDGGFLASGARSL